MSARWISCEWSCCAAPASGQSNGHSKIAPATFIAFILYRCGKLGAFAHGALGVELSRLARAADVSEPCVRPAPRFLPGANDYGVCFYNKIFSINAGVNPAVVDAAVFDAFQHPYAVARELGAMHPAGGAAERVPERAARALEHGDAVRRFLRRRSHDGTVGMDAPMRRERAGVERRAARALQEIERDVEADAAHADDRNLATRLYAARQHLGVARDLGVVDSGDRRPARIDPGRDHGLVESLNGLLIHFVI